MRCLAHGTSALHEDRRGTSKAFAPNAAAGEHIAQNSTKLEVERKYCWLQPAKRSTWGEVFSDRDTSNRRPRVSDPREGWSFVRLYVHFHLVR